MIDHLKRLLFLMLIACPLTTTGEVIVNAREHIVRDPVLARRWEKAAKEFDDIVFHQRHPVADFLTQSVANKTFLQLSDKCANSLTVLSNGLRKQSIWSYKCKCS